MSATFKGRLLLGMGLYCGAFVLAGAFGGLAYFHFGNPRDTCASCHEMTGVHSDWAASAHRTVHCRECHGGALTLDIHALKSHVDRLVGHFTGDPAKPIRLQERHVVGLTESCRRCHPQSFAEWSANRHSVSYARIFLNARQNRSEPPTDDCLRCHGMFFQGDITDLVTSGAGRWALADPSMAAQPAIPCLACHQVHAPADATRIASFFDHRERRHLSAELLPIPTIFEGARAVRVSRDPRQRLCMQCHSPGATHQLGSANDRTPSGVHEGLSCVDCHGVHALSAKASCAVCHPAQFHGRILVQDLDTTFHFPESRHDIHTVTCQDCHPGGLPFPTSSRH